MPNSPSDRLTDCPSDRPFVRPPALGIALLDVLVALTILGSSGLMLTALVSQALRAQAALAREEARFDTADRVLAALTLLNRAELDQRLGRRRVGEYVTDIERPERGLYRIALADSSAGERTLLVTVVHRAEPGTP